MARRLLVLLAACTLMWAGAGAVAEARTETAAMATAAAKPKPDKVVIIVVDALSREIVEKYDMANVEALMADGVNTPRGYLGHTGSVTVVTHNVITSGMLPKHMGWTNEGYRDVDGVLGPEGGLYITSDFGYDQMSPLQEHAGYPHLSDYLDDTGKVFTVSPKAYAAYGLAAPGRPTPRSSPSPAAPPASPGCATGSRPACRARRRTSSGTCGSPLLVERDKGYDTLQFPAQLYPATDDRYVVGDEPGHQGGDIWATDAALDIMDHEAGRLERPLRQPPRSRQGRPHVGRRQRPRGRHARLRPDDAHGVRRGDRRRPGGPDHGRARGAAASSTPRWSSSPPTTGRSRPPKGTGTATSSPSNDYGFYNWYYGDPENDIFYDQPQAALQPLVDTGNVGFSYSDSSLNVWLTDQSPAAVAEAAAVMADLPDVTAVWRRDGDHFDRVSPVRCGPDVTPAARRRGSRARPRSSSTPRRRDYGPDLIATLPDNTTYSVLGDHGGIQRTTQQIPIVFAGAGLSRQGPARRGAVGRHHADDPEGDGHHADATPWTARPTRCLGAEARVCSPAATPCGSSTRHITSDTRA